MIDISKLNERMAELDDKGEEYHVRGLEGTGKCIPYIGWYWREMDGRFVPLADSGRFIGICESNKWGYPSRLLRDEESADIYRLLWKIAESPTVENMQAFYDHLQTVKI